jgi:hypothetical protein
MSLKQKEHAAAYYEMTNIVTKKDDLPGILQFIPIRDQDGSKLEISLETCKLIKLRHTTICHLNEIVVPGPMVHILIAKECLMSFKNVQGFTLSDLLLQIGYMRVARNKTRSYDPGDEYLVDITFDSENHILVPIFR